ncbi:MAG: GWxTD domain-containing protein [Candidatus Latescibacteria bacterium]|nr:GWxTD domain-containing protein [Candidatus Latescibacterota bacterium]NIO57429.1 GWxTD domain-containing protein [Candidatus Latescibacterota bacterium]
MKRKALAKLCLLIAAGLTLSLVSIAREQRLDPKYVEFLLEQMPPEMRREVEALRCVLTPAELKEFLTLPYDFQQRRWINDYWDLKDPIFTTSENEIQIEHSRRVAYAESAFYIPKWPMWDQRGEVYIRYGPPDVRQIIPSKVTQVGLSRAGEYWYYSLHDMAVLFEDAFSNGEYTYYLERVKGPSGIRMKKIKDDIDAPMGKWMEIPDPTPLIAFESAYDEYQEKQGKFYESIQKTPSTYRYDFDNHRLPFFFSVDNFRGGRGIDRVDVNVEFEANVSARTNRGKSSEYHAEAVFWDNRRDEVARRNQRISLPVAEAAVDSMRLMLTQLVVTLPPGFYHMAVTLEEGNTGRIASYKKDIVCEDFDSKLAISDILFAGKISPATRISPFNRGALEVIPHPIRRYLRTGSIPVYCEVYNLGVNAQGLSSYIVEYRIIRNSPKELSFWLSRSERKSTPDVSSSFRVAGHGPYDVVHIIVEAENLREGEFTFQVKIIDHVAAAEVAREAVFNIVE